MAPHEYDDTENVEGVNICYTLKVVLVLYTVNVLYTAGVTGQESLIREYTSL